MINAVVLLSVEGLVGEGDKFLALFAFWSGGAPGRPDPSGGGKCREKEQKSNGGAEEDYDTTQGTGWLALVLVSGNRLDKSIFIRLMGRSREMLLGACACMHAFEQQAFRNVQHEYKLIP